MSRTQLLETGLSTGAIRHRMRWGRLTIVLRGVYRVGAAAQPHEQEMAAVLAGGPGALLSHTTAGFLWELVARRSGPPSILVEKAWRVGGGGVRAHRTAALHPDERTVLHGIPITTPARTLLDLAEEVDRRALERALARGLREALVSAAEVAVVLERHPGKRGARNLRFLLAQDGGPALTRSAAEERFLTLVRRAGLPRPAVNAVVEGLEVDFLWRPQRLVVEIDGFGYHRSRAAFEKDHRRDARLVVAGYRVLRFTWRQIVDEVERVVADVAVMLRAGNADGLRG